MSPAKLLRNLPDVPKELCPRKEGSQQAEVLQEEKELDVSISIQARVIQNYLQPCEDITSDRFIMNIVKKSWR